MLALALPPRLGGLGIVNPTVAFTKEHDYSKDIRQSLATFIIKQDPDLADECSDIKKRKKEVHDRHTKSISEMAATVTLTLLENLQWSVDFVADQGASHWLTACPWKPMDLLYPNEPLGMPYAFDTGGHRPICRYSVYA